MPQNPTALRVISSDSPANAVTSQSETGLLEAQVLRTSFTWTRGSLAVAYPGISHTLRAQDFTIEQVDCILRALTPLDLVKEITEVEITSALQEPEDDLLATFDRNDPALTLRLGAIFSALMDDQRRMREAQRFVGAILMVNAFRRSAS